MKPKILFVANRSFVLAYSRWRLVQRFIDNGWDVLVASRIDNRAQQLRGIGCEVHNIPFSAGKIVFWQELNALVSLARLIKSEMPDVVHAFNVRPIVFGSFLTRFMLGNEATLLCTLTGMGYFGSKGKGYRSFLKKLYRPALSFADMTIFQNTADRKEFADSNCVSKDRSMVIVGSGVDTSRFRLPPKNREKSSLRVIFVGRLLWQKGFREFVEVAKLANKRVNVLKFEVYGELVEDHPDGVPKLFIERCVSLGLLNYHGFIERPEEIYDRADVLVSLSSYGEGVPRIVLEASASGVLPVVRPAGWVGDVIRPGKTGIVFRGQSAEELLNLLIDLSNNRERLDRISQEARVEMEENFEEQEVVERYMASYRKLGVKAF